MSNTKKAEGVETPLTLTERREKNKQILEQMSAQGAGVTGESVVALKTDIMLELLFSPPMRALFDHTWEFRVGELLEQALEELNKQKLLATPQEISQLQ